jgi:hypothetical protein
MSADQDELEARLEKLEQEEREVSALRRKLHERLASFPNEIVIEQERQLSRRRRELHQEIDELRIKIRIGRGQAEV